MSSIKSFFLFVFLFSCSTSARSQDTCKVLGQKNPHGVAMEIRGPMTIADTINFSVESTKPLPYNILATDTIFFNVCIKAKDGKKHTTQVKYSSTHGAISYTITMQAPGSAGVIGSNSNSPTITVSPNPAKEYVRLHMENFVGSSMQMLIVDSKGAAIATQSIPSDGNLSINTRTYCNGIYHAIIKSGTSIVGSKEFVVIR